MIGSAGNHMFVPRRVTGTEVILVSMGAFDEEEHERREKKIGAVDADTDERRPEFEGRLEYVGDDSVDELLSRLKELKEA